MKYIPATQEHTEQIVKLVQDTIKAIYPNYYPQEVVDFFCEHHCRENIVRDINCGNVGVLVVDHQVVGTGSHEENHITRVYVSPEYQGKGYGSFIIGELENVIRSSYDKVCLDASLPASHLYEKLGYQTIRHGREQVEHGVVLVYEVMEKRLREHAVTTTVNYDGKQFVPKVNTENGEVDGQTVFAYHQDGHVLWAEYSGGEIIKGSIIGTVSEDGTLDFHYQHINQNHQIRIGKCHSTPHIMDNGKVKLQEEWQWLNGDRSTGSSVLVEM